MSKHRVDKRSQNVRCHVINGRRNTITGSHWTIGNLQMWLNFLNGKIDLKKANYVVENKWVQIQFRKRLINWTKNVLNRFACSRLSEADSFLRKILVSTQFRPLSFLKRSKASFVEKLHVSSQNFPHKIELTSWPLPEIVLFLVVGDSGRLRSQCLFLQV